MSESEEKAIAGEVWQEADGCLLCVFEPGKWWFAFGQPYVAWDDKKIIRPLRRVFDKDGKMVPEYTS